MYGTMRAKHFMLSDTITLCALIFSSSITRSRSVGTTTNEGTRVTPVRMTPDVVYYSWADINTKFSIPEYLKVSVSIWILLKERTLTLD